MVRTVGFGPVSTVELSERLDRPGLEGPSVLIDIQPLERRMG